MNVRARHVMVVRGDFLIAEPPAAGMQRLRARFSGHAYDRHRHETYAVGLTEGCNASTIAALHARAQRDGSS